jgi:hypothetical protein
MILSPLRRPPLFAGDLLGVQVLLLVTQDASTQAARNLVRQDPGLRSRSEYRQDSSAESANSSVSEELNPWYRF